MVRTALSAAPRALLGLTRGAAGTPCAHTRDTSRTRSHIVTAALKDGLCRSVPQAAKRYNGESEREREREHGVGTG